MLDQSFSAHNFETIYNLENRRGTIDIQNYQKIILILLVRLKKQNKK